MHCPCQMTHRLTRVLLSVDNGITPTALKIKGPRSMNRRLFSGRRDGHRGRTELT